MRKRTESARLLRMSANFLPARALKCLQYSARAVSSAVRASGLHLFARRNAGQLQPTKAKQFIETIPLPLFRFVLFCTPFPHNCASHFEMLRGCAIAFADCAS
jgi:hypothetical protein